ncbi:MAG: efflux RND transporter periplasmic adaptor subunit, partial [Candidatus Krumholzibacteriia bacterium]
LALAGCGDDGGEARAQTPARGAGAGGRPPEPAVPVAVQAAAPGDIASYYRATATLEAEKEATVLARVSGLVEEVVAEEGDEVRGGDVLLRIDNDEYRYRMDQARAATANLRARFERSQAMRDEQLITDEEFETIRSELATAEAEEGLARLTLGYTEVVAPFGGRVTRRLVDPGVIVSVGTALYVIADFQPLLARVHVPSKEFRALRSDQPVRLILDSDGTRMAGRIKLVSPVIDPTSGTIKLTIEVPDYPEGTRPGDFAQVEIVTERRPGVLLVPRAAVVTEKGETIVFVSGAPQPAAEAAPDQAHGATAAGTPSGAPASASGTVAERRVVELGFTDDVHSQILSGVAAGERVVVKGQRSLKHGTPLKILEDLTPGAAPTPGDTTLQRAEGSPGSRRKSG